MQQVLSTTAWNIRIRPLQRSRERNKKESAAAKKKAGAEKKKRCAES